MALTTDKIIEELNELIRFDFDAVGAYDEAIQHIKEAQVAQPLQRFRGDHLRHISDLSAIVRRLGGKPVVRGDFKGLVRKTMTKIAGAMGTETALQAMKSNEDVLNEAYARHATMDFPLDILDVVKKNLGDEQRHLEWVELALHTRLWEQQPGAQP